MSGPTVSIVEHAAATDTRDVHAGKIINAIKSGRWEEPVKQIRRVYTKALLRIGDRKAAKLAVDLFKKNLAAILWSGRFSRRANDALIEHSGLLCADIDDLGSSAILAGVRAKLLTSPYLLVLFLSPTGRGLKAIFRVPADAGKHAGSFCAIEQHVRELTGVQIDQACKDVARLCFISCDPDVYYNPSAREIESLPEPERPARSSSNGVVDLNDRQRIAEELLGAIEWQSETSGYCACPGKHLHTTGDNERDCKIELDNAPTVHCFHNSCRGILEGINHTLRSRIGKAERANTISVTNTHLSTGEDEPVELPPAPTPYIPPPLALFPLELQDYIHAAAESLNVDVSYVLLPLLSALGSAIGNARSILLKPGFVQPPIIWTGIIGRSGSRKSPALDKGCSAVLEHERELMRQNKEAKEIYDDELATWEAQRKGRGAKPRPPTSLTCLMDDLTIEVLADMLQANPRGLLVEKDELSHWLEAFDLYRANKGADVSRWLSLHSGVSLRLDRRTDHRHYRIHQPRVCITGGIQPKVLRRLLTEDFFERGLPARFLFAAPPFRKDRWNEDVIPERAKKAVRDLFGALYDLQPEHENGEACPKLLRTDADAKAEFIRYYNDCGDAAAESDEREEAAWSKLSGYAARLALIGQLARDPLSETITGEVMQAACDLARWFGVEAVRIYATMSETPQQAELRRLDEFIERRGGAVTVRNVMQCYAPLKNKKEETEAKLEALVKAGSGKWESVAATAKGGRPTRIYRRLPQSTSTKPPFLRGKSRGCVDVDTPSSQKTQVLEDSDIETVSDDVDASLPSGAVMRI